MSEQWFKDMSPHDQEMFRADLQALATNSAFIRITEGMEQRYLDLLVSEPVGSLTSQDFHARLKAARDLVQEIKSVAASLRHNGALTRGKR